jgi:hypothetical protein
MQTDVPLACAVQVSSRAQKAVFAVHTRAQKCSPLAACVQTLLVGHAPASSAQPEHVTTVDAFPWHIPLALQMYPSQQSSG